MLQPSERRGTLLPVPLIDPQTGATSCTRLSWQGEALPLLKGAGSVSRTFKDQPWWVTAVWWGSSHYPGCPNYIGYWSRNRSPRNCDLPPEPVVRHVGLRQRECRWEPIYPRLGRSLYRVTPPRWFIDHIDISPTRSKVRDDCRKAVKEYNGSGEVDVIPPINQHRHCATWLWT